MVNINLYWYNLQTSNWGHENFSLETKRWQNLDFNYFTVVYVRTFNSKSPLFCMEKHWITTVEYGRTFNSKSHIQIGWSKAYHTLHSGRSFPCHQPWLNWVDTWSEISLIIYILVKVSVVLTCICHNHCNGTALSLSVKEATCISWYEWYKANTKAIKLKTYIIIIKFAYITEVLSHIDSTAYAHLWHLNNKNEVSVWAQ